MLVCHFAGLRSVLLGNSQEQRVKSTPHRSCRAGLGDISILKEISIYFLTRYGIGPYRMYRYSLRASNLRSDPRWPGALCTAPLLFPAQRGRGCQSRHYFWSISPSPPAEVLAAGEPDKQAAAKRVGDITRRPFNTGRTENFLYWQHETCVNLEKGLNRKCIKLSLYCWIR